MVRINNYFANSVRLKCESEKTKKAAKKMYVRVVRAVHSHLLRKEVIKIIPVGPRRWCTKG